MTFNYVELTHEEKSFFEKWLSQKEEKVHLIKRVLSGEELVGMGGVIFRYLILPSFFLVVSEKHRNRGHGKMLLRQVLEAWGRKPLFLTVPEGNLPAIHIYEKAGFIRVIPWRKIRGRKMLLMLKPF